MTRARPFAVATAAIALMCTTAAAAQERHRPNPNDRMQTGSRFDRKARVPSEADTRMMQKDVARCVVDADKALARKVIANSDFMLIDYEALAVSENDLLDRLDTNNCIGRASKFGTYSITMWTDHRTFRGLMSEEVYLLDNKTAPKLPDDAPMKVETRRFVRNDPLTQNVAELSDCIVRTDTTSADALLRTRPASKAEAKAIASLMPTLEACAQDGLGNAPLVPSMVRMVVADGLLARTGALGKAE